MTPPVIEEISCANWDDLIRRLERLGNDWIHRAQRRASWPLKTTFERHVPADYKPREAEKIWRKEFERRAHFYLSPQHVPRDTVEWLALMQHYGAPTRLLDFTKSPYVASYFAIEDEGEEPACAVWSVNRDWCHQEAAAILHDSPSTHKIVQGIRRKFSGKPAQISLGTMMAVERDETVFDSVVIKHSPTVVLPIEPQRLGERLSVQSGTFLCTGNLDRSFMDNLGEMNDWQGNVRKFTLAFEHRGLGLEKLRRMNITRASLFPGLDGFAQSFRNFFARESAEQRRHRVMLESLEAIVTDNLKS
jgi:hypothetical protein